MTTANINSAPFNSIDATYPIAGQDNDSQGFRTNYVYIQQSFQAANVDITGLWANVDGLNSNVATLQGNLGNIGNLSANVTTLQSEVSVLQGNITTLEGNISTIDSTAVFTNVAVNQMGGNVIAGAAKSVATPVSFGTDMAVTLDYSAGDFHQIIATTSNITSLDFTAWPTSGYATLSALISMNSTHTITFVSNVVLSGNAVISNIAGVQSRAGHVLTSVTDNTYLFEFSTYNGGTDVYVNEKSITF